MREKTPLHAMAADGGAFSNRIRRLVGAAPTGASPRRVGFAGVLVVTMVVGLAIPSLTAAPVGSASAQAPAPVSSEWKDMEGEWQATGFGGSIKLHFERPGWGECSLTFDDDSFGEVEDGVYHLEREAGTFILEGGRFPRGWRKAVFRPDPEYAAEMKRLGYDIDDEEDLLELAIHDVTLDFARGIAAAGFDISRSRLIEFHIHDVTPEYIQAMADAGYDQLTPSRIVEFRIHGIAPEYVRRMAATGFEELTPSRIVEFRIHGVTPEFVRGLAEVGYGDMSPGRIVEFKIHDVSPEFIRDLADHGITDVSPEKLIEYRITGIPWDAIKKNSSSM